MATFRTWDSATAAQKRRAAQAFAIIPAFPNWFPFNEMLLDGILKLGKYGVKSRPLPWSHRGLTLLYSSSRVARASAEAHGYDPKTSPRGVILGVGQLVDVRVLTPEEWEQMRLQFNNTTPDGMQEILATPGRQYVEPFDLGYFFEGLKRFETPVPFNWPQGAVRCTNVPVATVAKALKGIGIREVSGIRI